ncbi:hypothetical protein D3C71_763600 [compost metagenome]
MKFHVGAAHAQPVGLVTLDLGIFDRCPHHFDRGVLVPGLAQRATFHHAPHPIDIDDRRHGGNGDKHAAIGLVAQQAVLGQQPESFAQRIAGDVETFTEGCL